MAWRQGSRKRASDAGSFDLRLRPQDRVGGPPKGPSKARGAGRRRGGGFKIFPQRKRGSGKGSGAGRSRIGRADLLGRRAGAVGGDRGRRHHRLGRYPPAADPVAGNSQAAAIGADPRRQRRDAGDARRYGRRRGAACAKCRPMCPTPSSPSRIAASIRTTASIRSASRAPRSPTCCIAAPRRAARR